MSPRDAHTYSADILPSANPDQRPSSCQALVTVSIRPVGRWVGLRALGKSRVGLAQVGASDTSACAFIPRSGAVARRCGAMIALVPSLLNFACGASARGPFSGGGASIKMGAVYIAPRPVSSLLGLPRLLRKQVHGLSSRFRVFPAAQDRANAASCRAQIMGDFGDSFALEEQDVCRYGVHKVQGLSVDHDPVQLYLRHGITIIRTGRPVRVLAHENILSCVDLVFSGGESLLKATVVRSLSKGAGASPMSLILSRAHGGLKSARVCSMVKIIVFFACKPKLCRPRALSAALGVAV